MKKYLNLLMIVFITICSGMLTSCISKTKFNNMNYKKIDYYVCGVYIEVTKESNPTPGDANPSVYFDFSREQTYFTTTSGALSNAVSYGQNFKSININSDPKLYTGTVNLAFVNPDVSVIRLHPIYIDNDGNKSVDTKREAILKIEGRCSYVYQARFIKDSENYKIELKLFFN